MGLGCTLRLGHRVEQRLEQRLELRLELRQPDIPDALSGTNENLAHIAQYMKEQQLTGVLWGGCATKKLGTRKDIDIILLEGEVAKFEEGIDWWTPTDEGYQNGFDALLPYHFTFPSALPVGLSIMPRVVDQVYGQAARRNIPGAYYPSTAFKIDYFPHEAYRLDGTKKILVENPKDMVAMEYNMVWFDQEGNGAVEQLKDWCMPGLNLVEYDVQKKYDYNEPETKRWIVIDTTFQP